MTVPSPLYRAVRLANAVLFALALGLAFDYSVADALVRFTETPHWTSGERDLVVVDRTGDPEWEEATRFAVDVWNDAAAGTGLHLRWETGRGACRPDGARISVCETGQADLGDRQNLGREGLAQVKLGQSHAESAQLLVCGDCELADARRRVIAAHEVGHALGLPHREREASVMFATGGPDHPDALDQEELRQLYAHRDGTERCGVFSLRLGAMCF